MLLAVAWLVVALAALASSARAHSLEELEGDLGARERYLEVVNRPAPGFALEDARGRALGLTDLRGTVVVLYFIYASCPDVCPLHSEAVAAVQARVNATPMRDLVRFVAVTTDPEHDTPEVMEGYGPSHGLDPANWTFLTSGGGRPDETRQLAGRFGLKFTMEKSGYQVHGVVTHLIDKSGTLRARYHGLKFNPVNMVVHINELVNDDH
ncbi:MAG: SCO family protein [Alphaproteobacteria bacterium]